MKRLDPALNSGSTTYLDGNATTGAGGTVLQASALNAIQEELVNVATDGGTPLNAGDSTQVITKIKALIAAAIAALPADHYISSMASYNATTNVATFNLAGGGTTNIDMTALIADAVASVDLSGKASVTSLNAEITRATNAEATKADATATTAALATKADATATTAALNDKISKTATADQSIVSRIFVGVDGQLPANGYSISTPGYGGAIELRGNSATVDRGWRLGMRNGGTGFGTHMSYLDSDGYVKLYGDFGFSGNLVSGSVPYARLTNIPVRPWSNVTGSRASGVTYTNSSSGERDILFYYYNSTTTVDIVVDGLTILSFPSMGGYGGGPFLTFSVPAGKTYKITTSGGSFTSWFELT